MKKTSVCFLAFCLVFLASINSSLLAQGQGTAPDPGTGGGNGGNDPTCTVTAHEAEVLVGHDATIIATAANGVPAYSYGFLIACTPTDPAAAPQLTGSQASSTFTDCTSSVGSHTGYAQVTDSQPKASNVATVAINVVGPNKLVVLEGDKTVSFNGGNTASALHKFVLRKDDEDVGPCLECSASEKVWIGATEPSTWEHTGDDFDSSPEFYFHNSILYDYRYYTKELGYDNNTINPPGTVLVSKFQKVKVDVPKCDGTTYPMPLMLKYEIIKVDNNSVRFRVTPITT